MDISTRQNHTQNEAYSEPCKTGKPLAIFTKRSIIDAWNGSECAFTLVYLEKILFKDCNAYLWITLLDKRFVIR